MKYYSAENDARGKLVVVIAFVSILVTALLYQPTNCLIRQIVAILPTMSWLEQFGLLTALEPAAIYGILWALLDNCVWQCGIMRLWHKIPNLNGTWKGKYESSWEDESGTPISNDMTMIIHQSLSKISVRCEFPESSESYADVVGIVDIDEKNDACTLEFSFQNQAIDNSVSFDAGRDNSFMGYNVFRIVGEKATGNYITLRTEKTWGYMALKRV